MSGLVLALAINLALLLLLLGLGVTAPREKRQPGTLIIDLLPESRSAAAEQTEKNAVQQRASAKPVPKPPPIILPVKPTIVPPP